MASISASQVKELRDKIGVGMMDAKKALVATDGDMDKAIDFLREKGIAKAEKKSSRVAAEGLADVEIHDDQAAIAEVNSETDFVASNDQFIDLVKGVTAQLALSAPKTVEEALALKTTKGTVNDDIIETTQTTGEKITLRRFDTIKKTDDEHFGAYLHMGGKIATLVVLEGADDDTAKDIAMHVAAINPKYVNRDQVPSEVLDHEREVLSKEAEEEGKPAKIIAKMVEGRLNKFLAEISLDDQDFVKDPDQTVAKYVASKGGKVKTFIRYEVGEGIEKKTVDFAEEVKKEIGD
ncbi:translation elongation factor Ts [Pediococcus inopinatus]|uniref:Elongation factor Ts n=1 Tax=Pediococcus inopinatus TaxID=114090 RepID=A0ABZ0Q1N3_9LACO|nr:translation elongation factor Ts [Pediococcus inopinatus]AVK99978.1 translation elongation factor Ts [Pediococcus inopinatus]KRN63585.1 translation elongation factor Ts [Pediococcus inopinatus]WPC17712.1 translation elongation factor Ts [Pediococcus inopinatus]WPC19085.1 translation elongation factor Ts [Pediococcus inopinatus]WPC20821.1 translation elongation factor Ts [Pediococcus inopinatus]